MSNVQYTPIARTVNTGKTIPTPTQYPLIGEGAQGKVYKISDNRCVKVYNHNQFAEMEFAAFQAAKGSPIIPRLYEKGANYLIMEYFKGSSLEKHLRERRIINKWVTTQLIQVLKEMKRRRFARVDSSLRHIFLDQSHNLKIIDLVNAYTVSNPFPIRLLDDLNNLGLLPNFLQQVKEVDYLLYKEWKHRAP